MSRRPIAVYHEHPDWFRPLFTELEKRGIPFERLDAAAHVFDPAESTVPWSLVFNRASPSAFLRGHAQSTFHTLHWLRHLDRLGVPVVNGADAYTFELSKATQLDLLRQLGLPFPDDHFGTRLRIEGSTAAEFATDLSLFLYHLPALADLLKSEALDEHAVVGQISLRLTDTADLEVSWMDRASLEVVSRRLRLPDAV